MAENDQKYGQAKRKRNNSKAAPKCVKDKASCWPIHEELNDNPYTTKQIQLFPQRIDENIAEDDPVRLVNGLIDQLDLTSFRKLYKESSRRAYHPRMMLKAIIYGYMNNVYSCRKIEERLLRDVHFIWLSGYEKPDFITINRFRNRVKKEINAVSPK